MTSIFRHLHPRNWFFEAWVFLLCIIFGIVYEAGRINLVVISSISLLIFLIHWMSRRRRFFRSSDEDNRMKEATRLLLSNEHCLRNFFNSRQVSHLIHQLESCDESNVHWINNLLTKTWPFANIILQEALDKKGMTRRGQGIPLPPFLSNNLFIDRFTLGDKPPVVSRITLLPNRETEDVEVTKGKVHKTKKKAHDIVIHCQVSYFGNCLISVGSKTLKVFEAKAGVKDIYFQAVAEIRLHPLFTYIPFVGGMTLTLLEPPTVHFDIIHLPSVLNGEVVRNLIQTVISNLFVHPNSITIPFSCDKTIQRQVLLPEAIGMCCVKIFPVSLTTRSFLESLFGEKKPTAMIRIGSCFFETKLDFYDDNWFFTVSAPVFSLNDLFYIRIHDSSDAAMKAVKGSPRNEPLAFIEFPFHAFTTNWREKGKIIPLELTRNRGTITLWTKITCMKLYPRKIRPASIPRPEYFPIGLLSIFVHDITCFPSVLVMDHSSPFILIKYGDTSYATTIFEPGVTTTIAINDGTYFRFYDARPESKLLHILAVNSNRLARKTSEERPNNDFDDRQVIASRSLDLKVLYSNKNTSLLHSTTLYRENVAKFSVNISVQLQFAQRPEQEE